MPLVSGLPDTKPEGALEITGSMSSLTLDFNTGDFTATFNEGESIVVNVKDVEGAGLYHFLATQTVARHLSTHQLVWANPEMVRAELDAAGITDDGAF